MNRKILGLLVVLCIASFVFVACQRPASVSPTSEVVVVATPTATELAFPAATQPQIMADILKSTQTALALATKDSELPVNTTSTPAFVFNTPDANFTLEPNGTLQATSSLLSSSTPTATSTTLAVGGNTTATTALIATATITPTPTTAATATATAIWYPTSTPGRPATYTIQPGEFLWCLARRFDVNVSELLTLNKMNAYSQVYTGMSITIPQSGSFGGTRALKTHPINYTVLPGDTMGSIACGFGDADPNIINAANGLTSSSVLTVGQVLYIP